MKSKKYNLIIFKIISFIFLHIMYSEKQDVFFRRLLYVGNICGMIFVMYQRLYIESIYLQNKNMLTFFF